MKTQLTEKKIQKALNNFFASWRYNVDGLYVFRWESDKLIWTQAGYIYEFEVKISRADYKNDFKHKAMKHILLNSMLPSENGNAIQQDLFNNVLKERQRKHLGQLRGRYSYPEGTRMPNYFYYAVPKGMLKIEEIPPYAGLVEVDEDGHLYTIRQAPRLHSDKYTDAELNLGEKFYYNMVSWKMKYRKQTKYSLMYRERLQDELSSKNREKSYAELEQELKEANDKARSLEHSYKTTFAAYMTMVEGADYNSIERHLLLDELEKLGIDVKQRYKEIMAEANKKYKERYPNRK